jgi:hypothetical protein
MKDRVAIEALQDPKRNYLLEDVANEMLSEQGND